MSPLRGEALRACLEALKQGVIPGERLQDVQAFIESCHPDRSDPECLVERDLVTREQLDALLPAGAPAHDARHEARTALASAQGGARPVDTPASVHDSAVLKQFLQEIGQGRYAVEEMVGRGGMGIVYRAQDRKLKRAVAIKILREGELAEALTLRRFQREAEAAAKLSHPHVVPIYDVVLSERFPYFTMQFVDGTNLGDILRPGPLGEKRALAIFVKVARAIAAGHRLGIIHRDIKPSNIIIDREGEPHVTDFGLAKDLRDVAELTASGHVMGTPAYMSPEQMEGHSDKVDVRSDVFGLGATLYHMVVGEPPFGSLPSRLFAEDGSLTRPRELNPSISPALEAVILTALHADPEHRQQTVAEMLADAELLAARGDHRAPSEPSSAVASTKHKVTEPPEAHLAGPERVAPPAWASLGECLDERLRTYQEILRHVGVIEDPFRRDVRASPLAKGVQIVQEALGERGRQRLLDSVTADHLPPSAASRRRFLYVLQDEHSWVNSRLELAVLLHAALMTKRSDLFRQVGFLSVADRTALHAASATAMGVMGLRWLYQHIGQVSENQDQITDIQYDRGASRTGHTVIRKKYRPEYKQELLGRYGSLAHEVMRSDCEILEGALTAVPLLFGRPAATVVHLKCEKDGEDGCELLVEWRDIGLLRRLLLSLLTLLPSHRGLMSRLSQLEVLIRDREAELERQLIAHGEGLRAAMKFQASLFGRAEPQPGISIATAHRFCERMGGDFYDILDLAGGQVGLLVADANTHGVQAAITTGMLKAQILATPQQDRPGLFLRELNARLYATLAGSACRIGVAYATVDPNTGEVEYASAGHDPIVAVRPDGSVEEHGNTGPPIGASEHLDLEQCSFRLRAGDSMWLYTDGLFGLVNSAGERLGREAFVGFIRDSSMLSLEEWTAAVLERCEAFARGAPIADDMTILSLIKA